MLNGKIAVITGANRGIGWATVQKFAQHHARVWACARRQTEEFEKKLRHYRSSMQRKFTRSILMLQMQTR